MVGATFQLIPTETKGAEGGIAKQQELVTDTHRFALKIPERWGIQLVSSNQSVLILEPNLRAGIRAAALAPGRSGGRGTGDLAQAD